MPRYHGMAHWCQSKRANSTKIGSFRVRDIDRSRRRHACCSVVSFFAKGTSVADLRTGEIASMLR